jgi:hypothetical protein
MNGELVRSFGIAVLVLLASIRLTAQTIPAADAAKHIGEHLTVCGIIASEHTAYSSRGTPTFINLDKPYPNEVFTVLVWGSDRERVGNLPESGRLCATGVISEYRGTPEIVLRSRDSWFASK